MNASFRRYEILIPLRFNDGTQVPEDVAALTLLELEQRFHAVSSETQIIQGFWMQGDQEFRDELMRVFVDVADTTDNRAFFLHFKEELKTRFQQKDIWMTSHLIDVL